MAFWLDRFRREDEEDIWEELKQMLLNSDKYEAEKKLQEARELEAFNKAWDKANGVNTESAPQKEPYLKQEDLLLPEDAEKYRQKQMNLDNSNSQNLTGFASPLGQKNQMGNTKVQRITTPPINLVNTNKNLVSSFDAGLKNKQKFPDLGSAMPQQKKIQQVNNTTLENSNLSNVAKQSYPESTVVLQGGIEKNNLTWGENFLDKLIQNKNMAKNYPIASDMYTDSRTDFSRARANKNATILENMNSLDSKTIDALKKYGVNSDERGVYHNENSEVSKSFGKSKELKRVFDKNLESIQNGIFKGDDLNFDAKISDVIFNKNKFDRHSSIQHAKLIDAYIDEQGNKHARIGDDYDFNKRPDTLKNLPNNHGYSLQEKGELENFFTVIDVMLEDDKEKEKLLNKLMKKFQR